MEARHNATRTAWLSWRLRNAWPYFYSCEI